MTTKLRTAWGNNYGSQLLIASCVIGVLFSISWYWNWLPQFSFTNSDDFSRTLTPSSQLKGNLVIHVSGIPTDGNTANQNGKIEIFQLNESMEDLSNTILSQRFPASSRGGATLIFSLWPGRYAAAAWIDLNGNDLLDTSSNGKPLEPFLLSQMVDGDSKNAVEKDKKLFYATFEIHAGENSFCPFDFSEFDFATGKRR